MKLAWGAHATIEFCAKAAAVAGAIGADPSDLMACMWFESRLDPAARNPASTATGLIQFMDSTARALGTTVDRLADMTGVEQLDYVRRYFLENGYAGARLGNLSSLYMAILWPEAINAADDAVIFPAGSRAFLANRGLDIDHDGDVTKREAASFVAHALAEGLLPANAYEINVDGTQPAAPIDDRSTEVQPEPEGAPMASALESIAGIAGMINPMAGGVIGLAAKLAEMFAPKTVARIEKAIGPTTGVDAQQAAALIVDQARVLTGKSDAFDAVAAARADPAIVAKVEDNVTAQLDAMAAALAKGSVFDAALWNAQNEGRETVSSIAIAERRAGIWDMTRALVFSSEGLTWLVVLGTLTPILVAVCLGKDNVALALLGFAGTIVGGILKNRSQPFDYRFDGTKEASAQTKALIDVASANKPAAR